MKINRLMNLVLATMGAMALSSCNKTVVVTHGNLKLEFDKQLFSKVNSTAEGTLPLEKSFQPSEFIETKDFKIDKFPLIGNSTSSISSKLGKGTQIRLTGEYRNGGADVVKVVNIQLFDSL